MTSLDPRSTQPDEPMAAAMANRLLDSIERHRERLAEAVNDPGHYRLIERGKVAYVPVVYGQDLPTFLRRLATEVERVAESLDVAANEGISHLTVDWEMDEGWAACLIIE